MYDTDYKTLIMQIEGLSQAEDSYVANLANASAAIMLAMEDINWAGFYTNEGDYLLLGPFQGKPACIRIPMGKGVCGTAALTGEPQLVADVHQFPGHIACDCASESEIVIPMYSEGRLVAVLDIDSPVKNRFSIEDLEGLKKCAAILEKECVWPTAN